MADYFSNIVDRNTNYQSDDLVPIQFLEQNSEVDFEEIVEENKTLPNNFDTLNTEKTTTVSSINTNEKPSNSNQTSNYFTNSYDRNLDENRSSIQINDDLNANVNFKNELKNPIQEKNNFENYSEAFKANSLLNPISKNYVDPKNIKPIENQNTENDSTQTDGIEQSVLLEKHFFLLPSLNNKQTVNTLQNTSIHTEINKDILLPQKQAEIVEKTENKNENPKLIIGKINVEILPVTKPTTKVINQIMQSPAPINFPKSNRNIFGLGQL